MNFDSNRPPFQVVDWYDKVESDGSDPDANLWYNNVAYGYTDPNYAEIEGTPYKNANSFNANYDAASNNLNIDPGLVDPKNSKFWPNSADDPIVCAGFNLGASINFLLDPENTDFKAMPPSVKTKDQPIGCWYIGAYSLKSMNKMNPPPEKVSGFHFKLKK